jgi:integrase
MISQVSISDLIKEKRPNLNEKSIKTYTSILKTISKDLVMKDLKDFKKTKEILEYLKDMPGSIRKTRLSALLVITGDDKFKEQMLKDINNYNKDKKNGNKNEKETEAWMTKQEIEKIFTSLKKRASVHYKKGDLKMKELQEIQDFVMLALFTLIPPRRALDFTEMKIKNIDAGKDNYIKNKTMIFNIYKTSKTKGQDKIEIPKELKLILNKWLRVNQTEYLLFDSKGSKLSSVKVNQRFHKIMKKPNFSVNMFRKVFLTDKYKDTVKKMKDLEEDLEDMGSSTQQIQHYVKLD